MEGEKKSNVVFVVALVLFITSLWIIIFMSVYKNSDTENSQVFTSEIYFAFSLFPVVIILIVTGIYIGSYIAVKVRKGNRIKLDQIREDISIENI